MKRERTAKWSRWRTRVARSCEELAEQFGGAHSAVGLREIAIRRKIKRVVFRPLLVQGGLGRRGDGFVMYVKCDLECTDDYSSRFYEEEGRSLPPHTRFTIAHEVVHTLFFDMSRTPPHPLVAGAHHSELESLEVTCNFGASRLLMPTARMSRFLERSDLLKPQAVIDIASALRVSLKPFLIRLQEMKIWGAHKGAVAVVDCFGKAPRIESFVCDAASKPLFPGPLVGRDARLLVDEPRLRMFGGSQNELNSSIPCRGGLVQPVIASCAPLTNKETRFVLTIRLADKAQRETRQNGATL